MSALNDDNYVWISVPMPTSSPSLSSPEVIVDIITIKFNITQAINCYMNSSLNILTEVIFVATNLDSARLPI